MKARLTITVLIFHVTVWFTEELTWNTQMRAAVCCEGKKQLLIWNFTKGENERVTELHWFFNEKTLVCLVSETTGFIVADLYEGRVEQNGTAGILLKNVRLNDTGEYTLYVKLDEEKEHVQGINLTVVEPPPNQCKPIIKKEHPKGIISCFTSCERSPLSLEWISNGTKVPGDIGPYLVVNSSGTSEQPICCLRDFKCLDDYQTKCCTQNNISFTEDVHTVNESVADTNHMHDTLILIILIVTQMVLTVVIASVILNRRRCWLYWPLQDSNQQVQIANNGSSFTEILQSVVQSNTVLMAELQASRKESRKLKRQLHREKNLRKKENRHKYSFELMQVGCSDFKKNDTETCETFESEDASSDDTDTFKTSEPEEASLELPCTPKLF